MDFKVSLTFLKLFVVEINRQELFNQAGGKKKKSKRTRGRNKEKC